jgi:hypothetical protein
LYSFVENPHSWRQLDTLFYAYDYYKNGIDLLSPSVSWMGGYKTVVLEFPILSALLSFMFYLPGNEVVWMRLFCFAIFLLSAFYLYKLTALFNSKSLALFTAVIYMMLPLSVFYSRALIADFTVMLCSTAMMYYYANGIRDENVKLLIAGSVFALFGAVMKVPYMFVAYTPVIYYIFREKKTRFALKNLYLFLIPVILFFVWQLYVFDKNSEAPDWNFIPGFFKFVGMSSWYFGDISDRFDWANWKNLLVRSGASVVMFTGTIFLLAGLFLNRKKINKSFFNFYTLGLAAYLIIFLKLNFIHDYYQLPFLVAVAFYIGVAIETIYRKFKEQSETKALVYVSVILIILGINGIWFTERWYYKPDKLRIEASEYIMDNTSKDDLIITSIEDTDPRDPRLNAPAYRFGWAIRNMDLTPGLIDSLKSNGANYLIYIVKEDEIPTELHSYLSQITPILKKSLENDSEREILIFKLQ